MRIFLFLLAITVGTPLFAAEPIGRLFFTPEQRALLDNARQQKIKVGEEPEPAAVAAVEPPSAPPPPENLSINGLIYRSDGTSTVWINNKPVNDKAPLANGRKVTSIGSSGKVSVSLPEQKRRIMLKVGQDFDAMDGQVQERFSRVKEPVTIAETELPPPDVGPSEEPPPGLWPSAELPPDVVLIPDRN
ncbi:MAG: hypothetical protein ACREV9_06600 [Burkholderiales bacterium]